MRRKFSKGCSLHVFEGAEPVTQIKAEREAPDDIDELQRMSVEHHAETHADDPRRAGRAAHRRAQGREGDGPACIVSLRPARHQAFSRGAAPRIGWSQSHLDAARQLHVFCI